MIGFLERLSPGRITQVTSISSQMITSPCASVSIANPMKIWKYVSGKAIK